MFLTSSLFTEEVYAERITYLHEYTPIITSVYVYFEREREGEIVIEIVIEIGRESSE